MVKVNKVNILRKEIQASSPAWRKQRTEKGACGPSEAKEGKVLAMLQQERPCQADSKTLPEGCSSTGMREQLQEDIGRWKVNKDAPFPFKRD